MLSLVIQAGGESRRMGTDKALLPFLGQPLILRPLSRLAGIAEEVLSPPTIRKTTVSWVSPPSRTCSPGVEP